jgi:hypothetical protein
LIDVSKFGFLGRSKVASKFNHSGEVYTLEAPTLNISAFYVGWESSTLGASYGNSWNDIPFASNWTDPTTRTKPYTNTSNVAYTYPNSNKTYGLEYIQDQGSCQQLPTYKWGFSFLLLFIVILLSNIWAMGTYTLWLDAYLNSRFDHARRNMGIQRAILDAANAMRKDMGEEATETLSNRELNKRIQRSLHGRRVGYDMLDDRNLPLSRMAEIRFWWGKMDLGLWAKNEAWWLTAWSITLSLTVVSGVRFPWTLFPALFLWLGISIVIAVGRSTRSRWLIPVFCAFAGLLLLPAGQRLDEERFPASPVVLIISSTVTETATENPAATTIIPKP